MEKGKGKMENSDQPVRCGCGGEAQVLEPSYTNCYVVQCGKCGIRTPFMSTDEDAIEAWNNAMARMTGHWISVESETVNGKCSVCGYESRLYENDVYGEHYCPNCGARLRL